jgi:mannosyltransferase
MPFSPSPVTESTRAVPDRPAAVRWAGRLTLVLLVVAGVVLRFAHLTAKPYWFDECFSVEVSRLDWSNFLHVLWWREANMTLYYLLLRAWLHFGQSEFFIRSLSVVISAATIGAVYWVASLLYDRRIALIAAALLAFNAYSIRYAQEARSYALFGLLATLSCGFLVGWLRTSSARFRLGWILTSILCVYAHLYALLLMVAQWISLTQIGGSRRFPGDEIKKRIRSAYKAIGIASAPLLIFVAKTGAGPIRWIHRPGLHDLLRFWEEFCGANHWILAAIYAAACLSVFVMPRKSLPEAEAEWDMWRRRFLFLWLLFPIALTVVLSFARPVFLGRYMIFCQPALVILAAAGIARNCRGWLMVPVVAGVLLLTVPGIGFVYTHDYDDQRDAAGAATNFILDHSRPGDGIIFHIPQIRVPYEFFRSLRAHANTASPNFTQLGPEILYPHSGPGLEFRDFKARLNPDLLRAIAPDHPRIWIFLMYNGPANPDPTAVLLERMLPEWFPQRQCWEFPKAEVCLYSREGLKPDKSE